MQKLFAWVRRRPAQRACLNCGEPGLHFVPPSMGDAGFFTCEMAVKVREAVPEGQAVENG